MQYMWELNDCLDEMIAFYKIMEEYNITDPQEKEYHFLQLMKALGKKPMGATELNKKELLNEMTSKGNTVFDISTDKNGKPIYKIIKRKGDK